MTDSNVVNFPGPTYCDVPVDQVIADVPKGMEGIVILGYAADGEEYFASSYGDSAESVWLMERLKLKLLRMADEDCPRAG